MYINIKTLHWVKSGGPVKSDKVHGTYASPLKIPRIYIIFPKGNEKNYISVSFGIVTTSTRDYD